MKKVFLAVVCAFFCMQFLVAQKPNSNFGGVQIGAITYSYRSMPDQTLEATLNYIVQSGINSVELMGDVVERYAGMPANRNEVAQWRKTVSMDKFREVEKMFRDRGITIHILRMGDHRWSDEELDYTFNVCKALGAKGICLEISDEAAKRMAPFADKHNLYVLLHNHGQPGDPNFSFDRALAFGPKLMLNFDIGHYFGATGRNPADLIRRLHNRIFSLHVKDKTGPDANPKDTNRPFGQGQTPIADVLLLIAREKWPIYCDIELEYDIPAGSDAVKETFECVEFCRRVLER